MSTSEVEQAVWRYDPLRDCWLYEQQAITLETLQRYPRARVQEYAVLHTGQPLPDEAWPEEPVLIKALAAAERMGLIERS